MNVADGVVVQPGDCATTPPVPHPILLLRSSSALWMDQQVPFPFEARRALTFKKQWGEDVHFLIAGGEVMPHEER